MSERFTCEELARKILGEPAKEAGGELYFHCLYPEKHNHGDTHPSCQVNPRKDVFMCGPCRAQGNAWAMAAFLAGCDPGDKKAVLDYVKTKGLLNGNGKRGCQLRRVIETYDYVDENGATLFQVCRHEPKGFTQRRTDGKGGWIWNLKGVRRVLYRLPKVIRSQNVLVCEGEKDAETAGRLGFTATCNPHGAGKWRPEYSEPLRGKRIAIIGDADAPGLAHARDVARSLLGVAESVKLVESLPGAKDLTAWVANGGTQEALLSVIKSTPMLTPADVEKWDPKRPNNVTPAPQGIQIAASEVLDGVLAFVRRFVSLNEAQARIVALWAAHTHCFEAADCTPYLLINSAEKQSGKTRLLEVSELLVREPWLTGRVSPAVLARKIDAKSPALLLDESDTAFGADKEYAEALRGALNTGYRHGGVSSCCVGQGAKIDYKDFSTFCPKAIAGIGKVPDTVADRGIPIRLKRAQRGRVKRFRKREVEPEASVLCGKLAGWSEANIEKVRQARPEIPAELSDRQADVSEPLLAIADLAGGDWPRAARQALVELCTKAQGDDESIGVKLLADIRKVFFPLDDDGEPLTPLERVSSSELAKALAEMEERPWAEWGRSQKPISQPQLAKRLAGYEIGPRNIRFPDGRVLRGYEREYFNEAWKLYLPPDTPLPPTPECYSATTRMNTGRNGIFQGATEKSCSTSENAVSANKDAACSGVALRNPGDGDKQAEKTVETRVLEGRL